VTRVTRSRSIAWIDRRVKAPQAPTAEGGERVARDSFGTL